MSEWNKESNKRLLELIGSSIKGRRIQQEISQVELSKLSGVSHASIARFETGKGNIALENLLSILKALEMADELKIIFRAPESSPSLLAKATSKTTRMRVRKSQSRTKESSKEWKWGEDK
ncbi:MAG: helix-turn-helix transcriptional regulator [Bacteriovorax sp.]|nr:helix-turn-helix transcriptional regulator [Bacteriovorax sp.]